jgi:hypothetical protein
MVVLRMQGPHRVQHVLVDHVCVNLGLREVRVPERFLQVEDVAAPT